MPERHPLALLSTPTTADPTAHGRRAAAASDRRSRKTPAAAAPHLPEPPDDAEKYSYFGRQRRWPFVWLFLSQSVLIVSFVLVMIHNPITATALALLTFMVPPTVVNFWLRMRPRRVRLDDHLEVIERWAAGRTTFPSVDVVIPCCGEDPEVLRNTYRHVADIAWPGRITVHVLDDADDPAIRDLAIAAGFEYVVRANRGEWKKAGNLINAFDQTAGEFFVVFDADFCPRSDFLFETVPYMDDPATGVVQTAQYFDVDGRVNEFARSAGILQELFFRWIQPARDTYEAAICAGTNVVYRRAAVVAAGGFAKVPLGEDVHSGVKIWVAEYRTRYLPLVLAKGLAPDTWKALTNQQYRWCRSSMLLMLSSFFREAPFSLRQRLCFWAAFLYYMSSAAILVTASLPTIVMIWGYPEEIQPRYYLPVLPALLATFFVFPVLARGWNLTVLRVATINSICHALAVWDALQNRIAAWVPTGAVASAKVSAKRSVPAKVALVGRIWFLLTQGALWAGVVVFAINGGSVAQIWPVLGLAGLQLALIGPVLATLRPRRAEYDAQSRHRAETSTPGFSVSVDTLAASVRITETAR